MRAMERRECRGAHQRADYPARDPALKVNFVATLENGKLVMSRVPVPEVPGHLQEWASAGAEVEALEGRLLE
jgi:succinate dehydrogenase / fumarate reductase, flavoprotein subunit